jgi:hypothetical protein
MANRLRDCAQIGDPAARIVCYDKLGEEALAARDLVSGAAPRKEPPAAPVAATPPATSSGTTTTSIPDRDDRPAEEFRIVVIGCQRNRVDDFFLRLDNGEVWKQTGGKKLSENHCNFSATVRKDLFGYKMTVDGETRGVRLKRIK